MGLAALLWAPPAVAQDPFVDAVASFLPGPGAGFGQDRLPEAVQGPPLGGGLVQGSLDVVSLGNDGRIVVQFDLPVICDGPGADFTVFENAFHSGSPSGPVFAEYGIVAVSQDGVEFFELPYDPVTHAGLAGRTPVLSAPDNGIDPLDPTVSGGDAFDLADVGLTWATHVRITDPGAAIPDPGNRLPPGDTAGFDLDAIAALHACDPLGAVTPTATPTATLPPTATPTPTPSPEPSAPAILPGDLNRDGLLTEIDFYWLRRELYDGDGVLASDAGGGTVSSGPEADVNGDGVISVADISALVARLRP